MGIFGKVSGSSRFDYALNAVMAAYTHEHLSAEQREQVNRKIEHMIQERGIELLEFYRLPEQHRYGIMATAMRELEIPPAIPGSAWNASVKPMLLEFDEDDEQRAMAHIKETYGVDVSVDL